MKRAKEARRTNRGTAASSQDGPLESLMHIWLAGLGAVSKAKTEGGKLLNELIEEGARVQDREREGAKLAVRSSLDKTRGLVGRLVMELPPLRVLEEVRALRKEVETMNATLEMLVLEIQKPRGRRVAKRSSSKV
jgi:hypothetical protein